MQGRGLASPVAEARPVLSVHCPAGPFPLLPSDFSSSALKASGRQGTLFFLQPSKFCCYSLGINGYSQAPESRGLPQQPSARPSAASTSKCIPRDFCPTGHRRLSRPELKHPASSTPALRPASLRNAVLSSRTRACWGDGGRTAWYTTGPLLWLSCYVRPGATLGRHSIPGRMEGQGMSAPVVQPESAPGGP